MKKESPWKTYTVNMLKKDFEYRKSDELCCPLAYGDLKNNSLEQLNFKDCKFVKVIVIDDDNKEHIFPITGILATNSMWDIYIMFNVKNKLTPFFIDQTKFYSEVNKDIEKRKVLERFKEANAYVSNNKTKDGDK